MITPSFFFFEGEHYKYVMRFIMKTHQYQLGQQEVKVVEHPSSTQQNLKYIKHIELTYEQHLGALIKRESREKCEIKG